MELGEGKIELYGQGAARRMNNCPGLTVEDWSLDDR